MEMDLEGRIELVRILRNFNSGLSIGSLVNLNNKAVYVSGAYKHTGKKCLVKLKKFEANRSFPISNFIKLFQKNDEKAIGLCFNEYLLYGVKMFNHVPDFKELNQFYDPGNIGRFFFFLNNSTQKRGRYMVYMKNNEAKTYEIHKTIREFAETEITYKGRNPVIFILENIEDAYSLKRQCTKKGLTLIKMDEISV